MKVMRLPILAVVTLLLVLSWVPAAAFQESTDEPMLIVYSTVSQLLAGDVTVGIDIQALNEYLNAFEPGWAVVGIGTTTQPVRNGELIVEGMASDVHYWWVDPSSESQAAIVNLAAALDMVTATPVAGATPAPVIDFEPEFPFVAVSVADPADALVFEVADVPNLHDWIAATLAEADIALAGLHVEGDFGDVSTSVGHNLPPTGIDTSGVYASTEYFHFNDYAPAAWTMTGLYAGDPDLQPVVSTLERPVHLHGYQPDALLGGHITGAVVERATLTVYPLENVVQTRQGEATPEPT